MQARLVFYGFPMGPCSDSCSVCSMGPHLVYGILGIYGFQIRVHAPGRVVWIVGKADVSVQVLERPTHQIRSTSPHQINKS